jgi:hypothetical protein
MKIGEKLFQIGHMIVSSVPPHFLPQEKYIQDLLDRASLIDHRRVETHMELNVHLTPTDGEPLMILLVIITL